MKLDPAEELAKAEYLEVLYQFMGRSNGLYTGLLEERAKQLIDADRSCLTGRLNLDQMALMMQQAEVVLDERHD